MSKRFIELLDRLLNLFRDVAESADPETGYGPRLPCDEVDALVTAKRKGRFKISVTPEELAEHKELIHKALGETVREYQE